MVIKVLMRRYTDIHIVTMVKRTDLGGLGVTCSPRDPRFAGSNPARDFKLVVPEKIGL